jgi:hypothetical protein
MRWRKSLPEILRRRVDAPDLAEHPGHPAAVAVAHAHLHGGLVDVIAGAVARQEAEQTWRRLDELAR